jgi:hypothetical protein
VRDALTGAAGRARRKARAHGVPAWLLALRPEREATRTWPHDRPGLSRAARRRDRAARCARQAVIVASWEATAAAAGTRAAFPWLDPRVLDLCLALPQRHFLPAARDKGLLRAAFADALPDSVTTRGKDGEPATEHQRAMVLQLGPAWWDRHVRGGALERAGLAPAPALADLLARVRTGGPDDVFRFLAAVSLGAWCRARGL